MNPNKWGSRGQAEFNADGKSRRVCRGKRGSHSDAPIALGWARVGVDPNKRGSRGEVEFREVTERGALKERMK